MNKFGSHLPIEIDCYILIAANLCAKEKVNVNHFQIVRVLREGGKLNLDTINFKC